MEGRHLPSLFLFLYIALQKDHWAIMRGAVGAAEMLNFVVTISYSSRLVCVIHHNGDTEGKSYSLLIPSGI